MEGYPAADLLVRALEDAGPDLTRAGLIAALEGITEYQGIFGYNLAFGKDDHKGVSESVLSVVRNGRWETLAESISY